MNRQEWLDAAKNKGKNDALVLQSKAVAKEITETEMIHQENMIPNFDPSKDYTSWKINSPVRDNDQIWLLLQPYNASTQEGRPADLRALWGLAHTTNPVEAKPYVAPYGVSGLYQTNECCIWEEKTYISLIDNNSYTPTDYPQGWKLAE